MSDDDLIRRGDAIVAVHVECECGCDLCGGCAPSNCICDDIADPYHDAESRIRALPAAPRPVEAAAVRLAEALDKSCSELNGLSGLSRPLKFHGRNGIEVNVALSAYRAAREEESR